MRRLTGGRGQPPLLRPHFHCESVTGPKGTHFRWKEFRCWCSAKCCLVTCQLRFHLTRHVTPRHAILRMPFGTGKSRDVTGQVEFGLYRPLTARTDDLCTNHRAKVFYLFIYCSFIYVLIYLFLFYFYLFFNYSNN